MAPSRRRRLLACWAVLTFFYLARLVWCGLESPPAKPFVAPRRLDVNRAGIPELMSLPGMGRVRSAAVVLYRVRRGWFRRLDELVLVDGIGPETLARLRPFLLEPTPPGGRRR